jgi:hypothetical protein
MASSFGQETSIKTVIDEENDEEALSKQEEVNDIILKVEMKKF